MSPPLDQAAIMDDVHDIRATFGFDVPEAQWLARVRQAQDVDTLGRYGPYVLLEEIGRGGQGSVYKARQPGTNRIIAIKRLAAGVFATPSMHARFEREVEAAAALSHPNIVRVYGTESIDGQQILAMEWINGAAIDRWASGDPPPPLRTLLQTFALACDAVSHAHQRGVLHRDLKPSNIIVDAGNQPHVLDFGMAAFMNAGGESTSDLTRASGFLGTPAYASPEHVAGQPQQIDARSDVYALGVILYQMLTGSLPFGESAGVAALFDAIRHDTPSRPSTRAARGKPARRIGRELDAIAMKAIEKQPQRRYQSVDALAADVRRYLDNETVLAHPPSAAYQARKFIARHRTLFAGFVIVSLTLIGALIGVANALVQTRAAQQETRTAQATAAQVNAFLNRMLASADPTVIRGHDAPVSALLDEAVRELDRGALQDQPHAQAAVRTSIAQAYQSLGLYPGARAQFEAALACWSDAGGLDQPGAADVMIKFADVLRRDEDDERALEILSHAERTCLRHLGQDDERTMRARLAKSFILVRMGDDSGRAALCHLLDQAVRTTGSQDNELVLDIKSDLAFIGGCSNDPAESLRMLQDILQTQRRLYGDDDHRLARTLINLGAWNYASGRYDQARADVTQALELRQRVYGPDHPAVASALYNLGNIARQTEGFEAAAALYRQALEIQERRLAPGHSETARSRYRLAHALLRLGRLDDAERLFRQAMDEYAGNPQPRIAVRSIGAARYAAECLIRKQEFEEAERLLLQTMQRATERFRETAEPGAVAASLVQLYETWGRREAAEQWRAGHAAAVDPASDQSEAD